ncbi:MAG TPA: ribonuclease, partial [Edaphobacter sp.]
MPKEIYISSTPHETRLAIVENDALTEIYYERENEYTLAGSIYNGRVTRVLPGMQSSFVDIGLERDAFLYITDFMEEAGDSAEFDGEGSQRGSGRRDRGSREPAVLEGKTSSDEETRSERGGRGRRGRRDRGGNREQQPSPESGSQASEELEESYSAEPFDQQEEESFETVAESVPGEGAPGADGSRRWRGRRNRRRGRGRQQNESPNAETPTEESAP